jgi:hypothetical protein
MSALLFIGKKRRQLEKIEFVSMVRMAMNARPEDVRRTMERWARDGEIELTFED